MRIAVETDRAAFRATAVDAPPGARVPVELRVTVPDPYEAYRRARDGPGGIYLETTGGQSGWGYFGVDPAERLTVGPDAVVADPDLAANAEAETYTDYRRPSPTLSALSGVLDDGVLVRGDCSVPYPCGVVGWLSYDVARELETLPDETDDERGLPRLQAALFDRLAAWKEPSEGDVTLHVTACPTIENTGADPSAETTSDDLDAVYDDAIERARDLAERALDGDPDVGPAPVDATEARFESDCGREAFADRVRQVKGYIRDGDTFQANISQRLVAPAAVHPVEAYDALREVNPAPYSGLLEFARDRKTGREGDVDGPEETLGVDLVSASPELLLHRDGRRLVTEPIAGTRPRGDTLEEDDDFERDLLVDEKERAEHAMLVDLERNDLGKVCEYGTVEVSEYRRVDRYSEVMHLVSLVDGTARPDVDLADALGATFPGGTITGAPKPRTMEIIDEVEKTRRGPYTGSMFVAGFDGTATSNIVIRTLTRWRDEYHLRVGAGIVHDSDPDFEYEETLAKGRALVTAIDEALAAGRMRVDEPEVSDD